MIKIGNIFLLFCFSWICAGEPFLRLVLPSGEIVTHVAAQQPVILELVSDLPIHKVSPHEAIAPFVSQTSQASSYKSVNGVASREYIHRWHLTFPKPHVLTVGPLVVTTDAGVQHVAGLVVTVVPPHDHAPMAHIDYDARPQVVGEWCSANIVFVVPVNAPCSDLVCPAPDDITVRVDQPHRSRIVRSGRPMDEIRYRIEWMAKHPGRYTLGPAKILYGIQSQGIFGFLGRFAAEQVPLCTDPITVASEPLPFYDGLVHAVGDIQKVFIKAAHNECARGSGISIDLCIIGGCTLRVDPEVLIPSTAAYCVYAAHQEHVPGALRIVYTIKPECDGEIICSIPDFTFFNTRTRRYETITVEPLVIRVVPAEIEPTSASDLTDSTVESGAFFGFHSIIFLVAATLFAWFLATLFRPVRILYAIRRTTDADTCAALYGELCSVYADVQDPYEAAQKLFNGGIFPLGADAVRWYLEQRYAQRGDWHSCRDAARCSSVGQVIYTYLFMRVTIIRTMLITGMIIFVGAYLIFNGRFSSERLSIARGTLLYYLPKKDPSLCAGSVAADGEAVILEKRDQWVFIRCALQRGWVDCSESATPGG